MAFRTSYAFIIHHPRVFVEYRKKKYKEKNSVYTDCDCIVYMVIFKLILTRKWDTEI